MDDLVTEGLQRAQVLRRPLAIALMNAQWIDYESWEAPLLICPLLREVSNLVVMGCCLLPQPAVKRFSAVVRNTSNVSYIRVPVSTGVIETVRQQASGTCRWSTRSGDARLHCGLRSEARGLPHAEMFTDLDELREGDTFTVEVFGEHLGYEVTHTQVVEPHETESLYPEPGRDLLTLVTCTPLGLNTHRILVTAERSSEVSAQPDPQGPQGLPLPWWALVLGLALILQMIYLARARGRQNSGAMAIRDSSH